MQSDPAEDPATAATAQNDFSNLKLDIQPEDAGKEDDPIHVSGDTQLEDAAQPKMPKKHVKKVWVWLRLTFLPVPKKGDLDVKRLRDSKYYFS